jgi:putative phosphoribosyl transferase
LIHRFLPFFFDFIGTIIWVNLVETIIPQEDHGLFSDNVEEDLSLRNRIGVFRDRAHAGEMLANKLLKYASMYSGIIIVAIPSGGLPVASEVAKRLHVTLDIMLVRKIPIPWNPEAGFGSVTNDGSVYLNTSLVKALGLPEHEIEKSIEKAKEGLKQRERALLLEGHEKQLPDVKGKVVVLVDDGLASGYTMLASVASVKKREPKEIVVAVPTGSTTAIELVLPAVDRIICLNIRSGYSFAVADAYRDWYDVSDEEAVGILTKFRTK